MVFPSGKGMTLEDPSHVAFGVQLVPSEYFLEQLEAGMDQRENTNMREEGGQGFIE
jgi:hypothetical protein